MKYLEHFPLACARPLLFLFASAGPGLYHTWKVLVHSQEMTRQKTLPLAEALIQYKHVKRDMRLAVVELHVGCQGACIKSGTPL